MIGQVAELEPVAHTLLDSLGVAATALAGVLSVIWLELRSVRKRSHELANVIGPLKAEVSLLIDILGRVELHERRHPR